MTERDPLLDELAALFDLTDPVPDYVTASAVAAPSVVSALRELDTGVLVLLDALQDTALQPEPAGVRSDGGPRLVTFGSSTDGPDTGSVEVEVGLEPSGTLRLVGLVVPTGPDELEVRHPRGTLRAPVDELGRFRVEGVPAGPLSLVLHGTGDHTTATDWITV